MTATVTQTPSMLTASDREVGSLARLLLLVAVLGATLLAASSRFPALILGLTLVFGSLNSARRRAILRALPPVLMISVITTAWHLLFGRRIGVEVVSWGILSIDAAGIADALYYSLRVALFVIATAVVTAGMPPGAFGETIAQLLWPLRRVSPFFGDLILTLRLSLRFVPILAREYESIRDAQRLRGVGNQRSWWRRLVDIRYLLLPVFLSALNRADRVTVAVEARGYDPVRQTLFIRQPWKAADTAAVVSGVVLLAVLWWSVERGGVWPA